jgi:hypothetical protein
MRGHALILAGEITKSSVEVEGKHVETMAFMR